MDFRISEVLEHPTDAVYRTYRDQLTDLVPYLPNVDAIEVRRRQEREGGVSLLNHWQISGSVPRAVRPFLSEESLSYLDHAEWDDAEGLVRWRLEIGAFPEAVQCRGVNYFKAGPRPGTSEVLLTGALTVDLARVRGVPRLLHRFAPKVESFVIERVRPNLASVTQAVARYLDDQGA